jgi:hypothetical protein
MFKGQWFRNKKTGEHVKIVEVVKLQTKDGFGEAYRLQDTGKASLTAAKIEALYERIVVTQGEPVKA